MISLPGETADSFFQVLQVLLYDLPLSESSFVYYILQGCYKKVLFDLQSFFGKCHLAYRFCVHGADRHIALGEAASVIQSVFQGNAEIDKAIPGIE